MFIKSIPVSEKKSGKKYTYYRLCESYRNPDGKPRHRTIINLGKLENIPQQYHKLLADTIENIVYHKTPLFETEIPKEIKATAQHFANIIITQKLVDVPVNKSDATATQTKKEIPPDYHQVDVNSIEHTQVREIGTEWLCKQTLDKLGLDKFLKEIDWNDKWIDIAMCYIIGRAAFPTSDSGTERRIENNSGLLELYPKLNDKITRHHFYNVSRMLYKDKDKIEQWLSRRTTELFNLEDKIILYDLTNTYFEGQKNNSEKAKFGRSKEKRNDAKLLSLALITDTYGFIKYSHIYEGNIRDSKTLAKTIEDIERKNNERKDNKRKVIVMDAGISTEENLKMLRDKGYDYVAVSLSKMKEYEVIKAGDIATKLQDRDGNNIWAQWLKVENNDEQILCIKSDRKEKKEESMNSLFCKRFEEGLESIRKGIGRIGGVKRLEKVYERIGRLKERYPSVHEYYEIKVESQDGIVTGISWNKKEYAGKNNGVYFIRTTLSNKDEASVWKIYNTIREIESTFRVLKSDLRMRPVFHQKDIYSEAHIYGSILAYMIVNSIRLPLKAKGISYSWSRIIEIMNTQKIVTTRMETKKGDTIIVKQCSEPEAEVMEIYSALGYKDRPFWKKKSVLPKTRNQKNDSSENTGNSA